MELLLLIFNAVLLFQPFQADSINSDSNKIKCPIYPPGDEAGEECPIEFDNNGDNNGYCSYSTEEGTGKETQTWAGNTCDACVGADYYIPGECPGEKVYCDPYANPPSNCTETHDPVCGFYSNNPFNYNAVFYTVGTFLNACVACQARVPYYVRGKCLTEK